MGGQRRPEAALTYIAGDGSEIHFPYANPMDGLHPFLLAHSPGSNQFDLIGLQDESVLRFAIPVEGAPLWENYIQALYTGEAEFFQMFADIAAYRTAVDVWTNYVMTHDFRASAAALSDMGGSLGQFSSTDELLIEEFTTAPDFFAVSITGSRFDDDFSGGELNDVLAGANGSDKILAQGGDDKIYGGPGDDTLDGQGGSDRVTGGAGADTLAGEDGKDELFGGIGDDLQYGGAGSDEVSGGADNDLLHGNADKDTVNGGAGADLLYGDDGNDSLIGGSDDDTLNGGTGKDTVSGGTGNDALSGGDGNDVLSGGDGDDFLRGGAGKDTLTGEAGDDRFLFNSTGPANADRIADFDAFIDKIGLEKAAFAGVHAALNTQEFRLGTVAQDGDDRIVYDQTSGRLYYDPDGTLNGAASAPQILFAILANHATLSFDDFFVV